MSKNPYMPFYGKQFYDDESVWLSSLAHQGLYLALLWHEWQHGSIPSDVANLARLVGQPEKEVRALWYEVSGYFEPVSDGRLVNSPLESIRATAQKLAIVRSQARNKSTDKPITKGSTNEQQNQIKTLSNGSHPLGSGIVDVTGLAFDSESTVDPLSNEIQAAERLSPKLDGCGLKLAPPDQIVVAWVSEYGEALIVETLADCGDQYAGKHWRYLESILTNRRDNPDQRPGNRRKRGDKIPADTISGRPIAPPTATPEPEPMDPEEMRRNRVWLFAHVAHEWIGKHGDPDDDAANRDAFNAQFVGEITTEQDGEDRWAKWVRVAGEVNVPVKPEQRRSA